MGKILRLVFNRLGFVLLITVILFSVPQQINSLIDYTNPVSNVAAVTAAYPDLNFSTYFGGSDGGEHGRGIALSEDGSYYVTGQTSSSDFPTKNAYNSAYSGNSDAIVAKLSGSGSILWSTYFGGSDLEYGNDIAVGGDGSCYVVGTTLSSNFPIRMAFDNTYSGNDDTFLAKFSANGLLLWSTYFGGSGWDNGYSIVVANDGSCYITGETGSSDFPIQNAYDSTYNGWYFDAFVAKFSTNGTLLWSSYLGGNANDAGFGIAVTEDGSCYITGFTSSPDFPTKNAYDATHNGDWDVFITKFSSEGNLLWSTFLGGTWWDESLGIAIASDGSFYVTGYTVSSDFPTQQAYNNTNSGWGDAFVAKFTSTGSLLWSTFLGGSNIDRGYAIETSADGSCYVTGETGSTNFPTKNTYTDSLNSGFDAFVTKFSPKGVLLWSTYHGGSQTDKGYGIAVTNKGNCFIVGTTHSPDFPTKNAFDNTLGATGDAFIAKFINIPTLSTPPFLVFIAIMPATAFLLVIALIIYKKRK